MCALSLFISVVLYLISLISPLSVLSVRSAPLRTLEKISMSRADYMKMLEKDLPRSSIPKVRTVRTCCSVFVSYSYYIV